MISEPVTLEELAGVLAELRSDRLLGVAEVATRLEVTPDQVRRWADEGLLPCERVGGRLVFRFSSVLNWEVLGQLRLRTPPTCLPDIVGKG